MEDKARLDFGDFAAEQEPRRREAFDTPKDRLRRAARRGNSDAIQAAFLADLLPIMGGC